MDSRLNNDRWDMYSERKRRKAQTQKLLTGITNYAFFELWNGNKEKASRAVKVALALENELDRYD